MKGGQTTNANGRIEPGVVYTLETLSAALGTTPRTLREQYLNTGLIAATPFLRTFLIPGYAVCNFVGEHLGEQGPKESKQNN